MSVNWMFAVWKQHQEYMYRHKPFLLQIARNKDKLTDGDVFILDLGLTIYQWNGQEANGIEKYEVENTDYYTVDGSLIWVYRV